ISVGNQTFTIVQGGALTVNPPHLTFNGAAGGPVLSRALSIDSGPANVSWSAAATTLNGGAWLSVTPPSGTAQPGSPAVARVTVNFGALAPGLFQGQITIQ